MLKITLVVLAVAGLNAAPIANLRNDVLREGPLGPGHTNSHKYVRTVAGVKLLPGKAVPVEQRRQGTQPSQAVLVDIQSGLTKPELREEQRHYKGPDYRPPSIDLFRQGTQPSQAVLVDVRTGLIKNPVGEMDRTYGIAGPKAAPSAPLRNDILQEELLATGQTNSHKYVKTDAGVKLLPGKAVPVEQRRQGTQPSQAVLVDIQSGLTKPELREEQRHYKGPDYRPPSIDLFRQGTQPSQAVLVDVRTGLIKNPVGEMDRTYGIAGPKAAPSAPLRNDILQEELLATGQTNSHKYVKTDAGVKLLPGKAVPVEQRRQGTQPSQAVLVDIQSGLTKPELREEQRHYKGPDYRPPSIDLFRQGTQPSQAVLVDVRTGLIKNPVGEMDRTYGIAGPKAAPSAPLRNDILQEELLATGQTNSHKYVKTDAGVKLLPGKAVPVEQRRQGTQPSQAVLVDIQSGLTKPELREEQRHYKGPDYRPPSIDLFRQGTQPSQAVLVDVRTGLIKNPVGEMERFTVSTACQGEMIKGRCYRFFASPQTFQQAESSCRQLSPGGHLAAVTSSELHSRLVALVTSSNGGPALTWLGAFNRQQIGHFEWTDSSPWGYSAWLPGEPSLQAGDNCLEMFKMDEQLWSTVDCAVKRAFICSLPLVL
ncbi:uncharacterized protein LOC136750740 [Amia ocellicauda]|uniref:uncharacterized protein LOC136750740 n=1 Tax=Amia ocellicauda TaxID=2972642 RepID=UPI003463B0EC